MTKERKQHETINQFMVKYTVLLSPPTTTTTISIYYTIKDFQLNKFMTIVLLFMKKYGSPIFTAARWRNENIKRFSARVYYEKIVNRRKCCRIVIKLSLLM